MASVNYKCPKQNKEVNIFINMIKIPNLTDGTWEYVPSLIRGCSETKTICKDCQFKL